MIEPWQQRIVDRDERREAEIRANLHLFRPEVKPEAPAVAAGIIFPGLDHDDDARRIATKIVLESIAKL